MLAAEGADVTADNVSVRETNGYGVVVDAASAHFSRSMLASSTQVGIWAQDARAVTVDQNSTFAGNRGVAVMALRTDALTLQDAMIMSTALRTRVDGTSGRVDVGDGVQAVGATSLSMTNVVLQMNDRVGVLVDTDGDAVSTTFNAVSIDGAMFGAVFQGSAAPSGWDVGITRSSSVAAVDAARTNDLSALRTALVVPDFGTGALAVIGMPE